MMDMPENEILSEEVRYEGRFFKVLDQRIRLSNGSLVEWETPDSDYDIVAVVAVDENGDVHLSKEWRPAYRRHVTTLPAGAFDKSGSEEERAAHARRELQEEVGLDCRKIVKLGSFVGSARIRIMVHLYLATGLFPSKLPEDEDEIIEVVKIPFEKALEDCSSGRMETTDYTLLGMMLAKGELGR
jgi:ADP-ribose pyrophosphatase